MPFGVGRDATAEDLLVLVGFEPDWQALYVDGKKVAEGHHVEQSLIVLHAQDLAMREGERVQLRSTHVEEDEADEYGEHDIPELLADIPPLAAGRISDER